MSNFNPSSFWGVGSFQPLQNRQLIKFTPSSSDYITVPSVSLTGDFEIEAYFILTNTSGDLCFVSDNGADIDWFRIDASNGSLDFKVNGLFNRNDGQFTPDTEYNTVKFTRVGTTISAYLNGALVTTSTNALYNTTVTIGAIGRRGGFTENYFDGIIANVKIYDDGDLVRYYYMNDSLATSTVIDSGTDASNGTAVNLTSADSIPHSRDGDGWTES